MLWTGGMAQTKASRRKEGSMLTSVNAGCEAGAGWGSGGQKIGQKGFAKVMSSMP